ncbi:MAG: hypothetical protein IKP78_08480 [Ruminococcus sp.]|nr:hypothetical protein [Ruminococcus sp.]
MFGIIRKKKQDVRDRTVYMEVCADNKVSYRVIAGRVFAGGDDVITYGIEAQDLSTGEYEAIPDFSRDIEDAVDFAEMLITSRTRPEGIYSRALSYLCVSI